MLLLLLPLLTPLEAAEEEDEKARAKSGFLPDAPGGGGGGGWRAEKSLSLSSSGSTSVVEFDISGAGRLNSSHTLLIRTSLVRGGSSSSMSKVSFDAMHGQQTTSWSLEASSPSPFSQALLCSDASFSGGRVAVVARMEEGKEDDAEVKVEVMETSIRMDFDQDLEATVTPDRPLTVLVDPVSHIVLAVAAAVSCC